MDLPVEYPSTRPDQHLVWSILRLNVPNGRRLLPRPTEKKDIQINSALVKYNAISEIKINDEIIMYIEFLKTISQSCSPLNVYSLLYYFLQDSQEAISAAVKRNILPFLVECVHRAYIV